MNLKRYRDYHLSQESPKQDYLYAWLAWMEYHVATEDYDRTLPGRFLPSDDTWMPDPPYMKKSMEFARSEQKILMNNLAYLNLDKHELEYAKVQSLGYGTLENTRLAMFQLRGILSYQAQEGGK